MCDVAHWALLMTLPSAARVAGVDGLKPPWKKPHVIPRAFSRSPILRPVIITLSRVVQSSKNGWGSLMTEPAIESTPNGVERSAGTAPPVWPEIRFRAPGVDARHVMLSRKYGLARQVGRVGVGREVMVEGDVLLEDHHDVLDRRLPVPMAVVVVLTRNN